MYTAQEPESLGSGFLKLGYGDAVYFVCEKQ
jgi:hypothetical protein